MAPATTKALQELARTHRLTLNTLIQGAWALVLANGPRTEEVVFGVTAAVRPVDLPGAEDMVGHLINTLPTRVRLVPGAPVLEWLAQLQAQQAEQRQFSHVPLSTLRRWTGLPDDSPLFDSVLRFENYPIRFVLDRTTPGFTVEAMRIIDRWPYPLSLVAVPGPPLRLELGWQRDRIDEDTATRALAQMQYVLERLLGDPGQRLCALMEGLQEWAPRRGLNQVAASERIPQNPQFTGSGRGERSRPTPEAAPAHRGEADPAAADQSTGERSWRS